MKKILFFLMTVGLVLAMGMTAGYAQQMGPGMMGPGYENPQQGQQGNWNYCPYCGNYLGPEGGYGYGMGPGMMGGMMGRGYYGMGPSMMGRGYYGMGPGMMGRGYYGMGPGMMGRGYYGMGPGMMGRGYGMGPGMMGPGYGYGPYGPGYRGPEYQQPQKPMDEAEAKEMLENYLASTRNPNLKLGKIEDKGEAFVAEIQTKDGSLVDKIAVNKSTGWMHSVY